ncbi:nucleoside triphosphate pyrophosphohydrolase [Streptomyces adustus]|uniref:nucleoside triphosphate pyrophosphohydrolase n=1 Tax=Streptomyces adustus TaxID=1609272 RepID=UPI00371253F4
MFAPRQPTTRLRPRDLQTTQHRYRLRDKLGEEVAEFLEADEDSAPEELADVLEVVRALAADLRVDADQLEKIREAKAGERGGFAKRIVWTGNH